MHLVSDRGGERRELRVPVFSGGASQGDEVLPVVAMGDGRYLLLASPGFVEGLAAGDVFELDARCQSDQGVVVLRDRHGSDAATAPRRE